MDFNYRVNSELNIPLYEQLIDMLTADIKSGRLPLGTKLPTVRELSTGCDIARGTVMRAYDELEARGTIEKIQGRGTFVSYRQEKGLSRIEAATQAIDLMLDKLETLNFSENEIKIYLELKLKERNPGGSRLHVAVVDCNYETMSMAGEQIRSLGGVDVTSCHIDEVLAYPYKLADDIDLVIVSASHADALLGVLPDSSGLIKVALGLLPVSVSSIARIPAGSRVGVLCSSLRFGSLMENACRLYAKDVEPEAPEQFSGDVLSYISGKDLLLVPEKWERYCSGQAAEKIRRLAAKGRLIECIYRIDDGSFINVEDRVRLLREQKNM